MLAEQQMASCDTPFRSLAELRSAHASLMREARKDSSAATVARVTDFIKRAESAGAVIESQNDRELAQSVLDYWAAWQLSANKSTASDAPPATLAEFVPSIAPHAKPLENPFVGLRAFEEKDTGYFIGREEATRSLLDRLKLHPIVFLSGPLGSGKSSLVFAGVVPRLRSRSVLETRKEPVFPVVIPGSDPLTALLKAVLQVAAVLPADADTWIIEQRKRLQRSPKALGEIVEKLAPGSAVVLIVDQFEEIFTLCSDAAARDQFTQAVAGLVEGTSNPNRAVLIVREDYAQQTYAIAALGQFAQEAGAQFSPPQLTGAELIRVITGAADAVGLAFEDGIVEELAQDVAGDPASLPTLQFTLSRLWNALPADGNRITREIYRQVGKPRVALARAAEAAFESLSSEDQDVAQRQFLELVQPAIGGEVRRRRIPLDNLAQLTGDSAGQIVAVLKKFEDVELVRRTKGLEAGDDRFEVAHEALVKNWRRLDDWLRVKRQQSEKKLQLITTARLWRESGQSPGYLLRGDAIKDALPYRDQAPEVRDLIAASERSERREAWRNRLGGLAIAAIFGAVMMLLFFGSTGQLVSLNKNLSKAANKSDSLAEELAVKDIAAESRANIIAQQRVIIAEQQKVIDQMRQQMQGLVAGAVVMPPPPPPQVASAAILPPQVTAAEMLPPRPQESTVDPTPAGQEGWIWIGSDPDTNVRDMQNAAVLPSAIRPDARYVIAKNVVLRGGKPSDTYAQAQGLGLVPNGTPITALATPIPYDRPSGTRQYWLPVRVDPSNKPIVYYQCANTTRPDAQQLADAIQAKGYRIPEIQTFDIAKGTNEVRYFFPADRAAAVKLAANVTQILKDRHVALPATKVVDLTGSPHDKNYPGVLELWLDTGPRE